MLYIFTVRLARYILYSAHAYACDVHEMPSHRENIVLPFFSTNKLSRNYTLYIYILNGFPSPGRTKVVVKSALRTNNSVITNWGFLHIIINYYRFVYKNWTKITIAITNDRFGAKRSGIIIFGLRPTFPPPISRSFV